MKRSKKLNAFDILMQSREKKIARLDDDTEHGIPSHLKTLSRKCPQWRKTMINLCNGESQRVYRNLSYKEMEREISNRNDIETAYNSIKKKSEGLCQTLGKRLNNVYSKKSFPKAEQDRFAKATFDKGKALKKRIDVFFFGGQVYLEHRKASKSFDGLLDLKLVASNRGDTPYFRELQMMFDELNSFTRFLSKDIETIIDYINRCGNITRKYNLDIQAKGPQGLATRKSAKRNKQKGLASLGDAPSIFIPLTNVLIGVQNTDKVSASENLPLMFCLFLLLLLLFSSSLLLTQCCHCSVCLV